MAENMIDLNGLVHVYSIIKVALDGKLGKNDTAVNASKVNNLTVETAVPKNAKFTDTVYMHPSTHPASMITGLASVATSGNYNDLANKPGDATKSSAGLMSAADKSKLDGISSDGAYIVAALLEQNGYVKFSNGLILQWGIITCTTGREGEFIFPISFTTKCLSFAASASIPANLCTITTAKFTAHDMNYGIPYKEDVFGLFIGI